MTKLEQINLLKIELSKIDDYIHKLTTKDHHGEFAQVVEPASSCIFEICWQHNPGSKNYHNTATDGIGYWLKRAAMAHAIGLMQEARDLCAAKIRDLQISRKEELEQELKEIQELLQVSLTVSSGS